MRGKVSTTLPASSPSRITPAYAGKRLNDEKISNREWDHPRLCGEKRSGGSTLSFVKGSPPPMRGKVILYQSNAVRLRITPAYAGKRE